MEPKKTRTSDDDIIVLHQISHCLEDILESDDDIVLPSIHTVPFMIFGVVGLRALTSQQQMNVQCITKIELFLTNHISVEVRDHLGLL